MCRYRAALAAIAPRGGARSAAAGPHEHPPPPRCCSGGQRVGLRGRERPRQLFVRFGDQAGLLPLVVQRGVHRGELAAEHPVLGLKVHRLPRERRGVIGWCRGIVVYFDQPARGRARVALPSQRSSP